MAINDIKLEILSSGHIKFRRGDKAYNKKMKEIISFVTDGDEKILKEMDNFLKESEDTELLIGNTIFCGQRIVTILVYNFSFTSIAMWHVTHGYFYKNKNKKGICEFLQNI